jgi:hypothetical protein
VTYTLQNIKLWPSIPKLPAFSTVEEYNILSAYGNDGGVFTDEGALPSEQDSSYERKTALVKFLGTTRTVTHPMTMVRPAHGNVVALETQNGAVYLVEKLERALFHGDSDIVAQEFDGIEKQMLDGAGITAPFDGSTDPVEDVNSITIDLRGAALSEYAIEEASNRILENYGAPSTLHCAPRAQSDLSKSFYGRQYGILPVATGQVGLSVSSMVTGGGTISLKPNVFLRPGRNAGAKTPPTVAATGAPTMSGTASTILSPANGGGDPTTKWVADDAGNYLYKITAVNKAGESLAVAGDAAAAVVASDKVTISIPAAAAGTSGAATGFRIYRSDKGGTAATCKLMCTVPAAASGATAIVDRNHWIPSTSRAYMFQDNLQFYSFRQLAPMMKIPLATIAASIRWMQLLYGTPIVYAPRKSCIFINVKDD